MMTKQWQSNADGNFCGGISECLSPRLTAALRGDHDSHEYANAVGSGLGKGASPAKGTATSPHVDVVLSTRVTKVEAKRSLR